MSRLRSVVISAGILSILSVSAAFAHPPPPFDHGWRLCFNKQNQHVAYHFNPKLDPEKEAVTFRLDSTADSFYKLNVTNTTEPVEVESMPIHTVIGTNAVPIDKELWEETVGWCEKFGGGAAQLATSGAKAMPIRESASAELARVIAKTMQMKSQKKITDTTYSYFVGISMLTNPSDSKVPQEPHFLLAIPLVNKDTQKQGIAVFIGGLAPLNPNRELGDHSHGYALGDKDFGFLLRMMSHNGLIHGPRWP
jgi:hypothetical protein